MKKALAGVFFKHMTKMTHKTIKQSVCLFSFVFLTACAQSTKTTELKTTTLAKATPINTEKVSKTTVAAKTTPTTVIRSIKQAVLKTINPIDNNQFIPKNSVIINSIGLIDTTQPAPKTTANPATKKNTKQNKKQKTIQNTKHTRAKENKVTPHINTLKPADFKALNQHVDATSIDTFIAKMHYRARHYPTNFDTNLQKNQAIQATYQWLAWIKPYAKNPYASFDILFRAAQLNMIARNLELGENYLTAAFSYFERAKKLQPKHPELLFLYGSMLGESGAFNAALNYLNQAAEMQYYPAYQSMAQLYLLTEKRDDAINILKQYQLINPTDPLISRQITKAKAGEYYIWAK